jgi:hypothetical protein
MKLFAIVAMSALLTVGAVGCEDKKMEDGKGSCPTAGATCPDCGAKLDQGARCLRCDLHTSDYDARGQRARQASDVGAADQPGSTCVIEPSADAYQDKAADQRSDVGSDTATHQKSDVKSDKDAGAACP